MLFKGLAAVGAALCVCLFASWAQAGVIDEVSVGGFSHDFVNITDGVESNLTDVQLEVDTGRPQILRFLGAPRLNAYATFNGARHSDVYGGGLVWDHQAFWRQLYVTLDFGLAYTDGVIKPPPGATADNYDHYPRLLLGSNLLFRTAPGLEWHFDNGWVVGGQLIHLSNAGLLGNHHYNRGINDIGLRLGYRFK